MEHKGENCTNRDWCFCYSKQMIIKGTRGLGDLKASGGIIENDQNTEKSLGDLR